MLVFDKFKWLKECGKTWSDLLEVRNDMYYFNSGWVKEAHGQSRDDLIKDGYIIHKEWCLEK